MTAEDDQALSTTPTEAQSKGTLIRQLQLVVLDGPDAGLRKRADGERLVIGKHDSCDVVLADDTVSRFHCELRIEEGRAVVRDLESRNGTTLDGVAISKAYARSGSVLTLGTTRLRLDLGDDHVLVPLSGSERFGALVGRSPAMRTAFALLERAAATDATVLLEGESGTGKEAAAEGIHAASTRRNGPLLVIDCGAIPPDELEVELFGHEPVGAAARQGAFEAAKGGTIFLDEVGEIVGELQAKLLRALEKREIRRVGATQDIPVDVRVIAATNRNLRTEVNAGRFRPDLFLRLAVIEIALPPLRAVRDDMPLIVNAMLDGLEMTDDEAARFRSPDFIDYLTIHAWPGNVRELHNYLERCIALQVRVAFAADARADKPLVDARIGIKQARESWNLACERVYLEQLLTAHQNNVSSAARAAGIDRPYLYRLLWRHKLR